MGRSAIENCYSFSASLSRGRFSLLASSSGNDGGGDSIERRWCVATQRVPSEFVRRFFSNLIRPTGNDVCKRDTLARRLFNAVRQCTERHSGWRQEFKSEFVVDDQAETPLDNDPVAWGVGGQAAQSWPDGKHGSNEASPTERGAPARKFPAGMPLLFPVAPACAP